MIDYLLAALIAAAIIQPTSQGRAAACTFAGLTVTFDLIRVPAEIYYLAAAATDGMCALLLSRLAIHDKMAFYLQNLCLLSLIVNIAGWCARQNQMPPAVYDSIFLGFYSIVIVLLIMRRIGNAYGSTTTYRPWIPFNFHSCFIGDTEYERGTGNW